jgi:hypothetical protein
VEDNLSGGRVIGGDPDLDEGTDDEKMPPKCIGVEAPE